MLQYYLYRFGQFIALHLPLKLGYRFAVFCSDLHYVFANRDREAVTANLRMIFPDKSKKEIARLRLRMFRNFAKYLVDFFRFEELDLEYVRRNIRMENMHYFDEALQEKKGVVVLTAHLGNWELGGVVIALLGYPFYAVALPHKHRKVDEFFNAQREHKGVRVIPFGRAVRMCLNILEEGKMVALVGDRDFTARGGITMDFFGKPATFPVGPAAFALKTSAPIVPGFMIRNPDDTFTLRLEPPLRLASSGDKAADTRTLIAQYVKIFEKYIREHPDQWYMFRKFWVQ
ncbi:MAG: lysophospholipid acyltransferase family protein [Candidatus Omnitrophica bacterium]|nr:lysophospholipid acyltransferase family protein [Candidatus Omnitrophota bacterium]